MPCQSKEVETEFDSLCLDPDASHFYKVTKVTKENVIED